MVYCQGLVLDGCVWDEAVGGDLMFGYPEVFEWGELDGHGFCGQGSFEDTLEHRLWDYSGFDLTANNACGRYLTAAVQIAYGRAVYVMR